MGIKAREKAETSYNIVCFEGNSKITNLVLSLPWSKANTLHVIWPTGQLIQSLQNKEKQIQGT